jgi:hypothetical protein
MSVPERKYGENYSRKSKLLDLGLQHHGGIPRLACSFERVDRQSWAGKGSLNREAMKILLATQPSQSKKQQCEIKPIIKDL